MTDPAKLKEDGLTGCFGEIQEITKDKTKILDNLGERRTEE